MIHLEDYSQGWILTTLSSLLCVLGTLIVVADDLYYFLLPKFITSRYPFKIKQNYKFLNGSLGFSAGCLMFTSLYRLLPEAKKNIFKYNNGDDGMRRSEVWLNVDLTGSYILGIVICLLFNWFMHLITSESVVHCNHGGDVHPGEENEEDIHEEEEHGHAHGHSHGHSHSHDLENQLHKNSPSGMFSANYQDEDQPHDYVPQQTEETPLIGNHPKVLKQRKSIIQKLLNCRDPENGENGECKGYSSAELCTFHKNLNSSKKLHYCEIPTLSQHHHHHEDEEDSTEVDEEHVEHEDDPLYHGHSHHQSHKPDHHHHVNSPISRLLTIGIQTTLAITLHKLPEGFITYITSETNPNLGVSIFISLVFHNFTEGFSMCLPLYYSMESSVKYPKILAISVSSLLGGLSQPLGALMGYFFLLVNSSTNKYDIYKLNYIFGITMAITSGFLTVISISMYGSGVSFGGDANFVMTWCIIGICTIAVSSILK
ncbi:ZRT3 Zinc-regulated transporter 3 [Candida maltosa Xu316]